MAERLLTDREVAAMLRRSLAWFRQKRSELETIGFPARIPVVGRYDARAVEAWLDQQGRERESSGGGSRWMERLRRVRESAAHQ